MWIDRVLESPSRTALEWAARFAEARHQVLAENIANLETPHYRARRLDPQAFQTSLREALERVERRPGARLELRGNAQFATQRDGSIRVAPVREPPGNVQFHDGTSQRVEESATEMARNALSYDLAMAVLKRKFDTLLAAIRGRTT